MPRRIMSAVSRDAVRGSRYDDSGMAMVNN